ncbi:hypothetical protein F2P81_020806 [Scophthalmus maximus]|uniref:Uncharacterized protein n=1 Tax=Scophthalmus maximus TaxID=52904 RepID=A0A6A4S0L7_SCOMX|nr:hypothetical protein F2P81_020806 [Scophthalmus maximus]
MPVKKNSDEGEQESRSCHSSFCGAVGNFPLTILPQNMCSLSESADNIWTASTCSEMKYPDKAAAVPAQAEGYFMQFNDLEFCMIVVLVPLNSYFWLFPHLTSQQDRYGCIVLTVSTAALRTGSCAELSFPELCEHNGNKNSRFPIMGPAIKRLVFQRMENFLVRYDDDSQRIRAIMRYGETEGLGYQEIEKCVLLAGLDHRFSHSYHQQLHTPDLHHLQLTNRSSTNPACPAFVTVVCEKSPQQLRAKLDTTKS